MDYAFLMNFATNYSDYFLMIEDDVKCAPGFVSQIATILSAWERKAWVTLEFARLGFIGKLFHARDLPCFVRFLLLFYQEMPCDYLLSHFRDLLMQKKPIQFFPSLFQHMGNYSSFEGQLNSLTDKEFEGNNIGPPGNPAATIHTSLNVTNASVLMNAYSLDKNFFYIKEAKAGSHLTVVLDIPATVFRVQVLTGSELKEENQVKEGQVELGYDSTNRINDCDDYILLGLLVNGILDKQVLSEESGKKLGEAGTFPKSTLALTKLRELLVGLLTVGIASMQHPRGSYLLDTLQSMFQASSERELEYIVVLVHLSGSDKDGRYRLQQGQVELGYDPQEDPKSCARYALLGPLAGGNLDQIVFFEEESVEELSCIRLLVLASQESWLLIKQIKVRTEPDEEER
ncbi:hypothetical protein H8959_017657 [Pygathrix nigripes]